MSASTVRDETFAVMRRLGLTRIFGNPGSTEIAFLADLPDGFDFVLGLHEGAVVGMASGYALGTGRPAFVNLHTAAGLGNAVNAIVCARDNRVPLVVVVGQQDRRQLSFVPFLAGRNLERLAGDYPVWTTQPADAASVPGAIARAWHESVVRRGPALVVVPMGDWDAPLGPEWPGVAAPDRLLVETTPSAAVLEELAALVDAARSPALVVGAGLSSDDGWAAGVALAERLACPVWQDAFSSRAGFPHGHRLFQGHLPWSRAELRVLFAETDLVLAAGTPAFRLYLYDEGPLVVPSTRVAVVSDDPEETNRSRCDLAVLAAPEGILHALAEKLSPRQREVAGIERPPAPEVPAAGEALGADHLLHALTERLPADAVLVEEAPSNRPALFSRLVAGSPLGFVAVANGALGFGLPAAIGLRLALPERPVVALLGDGSATYTIQALWSASHYGAGVVFCVVGNGGYAVMDEIAAQHGGAGPWPSFVELDLAAAAHGFGCAAETIATYDDLVRALDDVVPGLRDRRTPLLLDVRVEPGA